MSFYEAKNINIYKKQLIYIYIFLVFRWFSVQNLNPVSLISDSKTYFNIVTRQMHLEGDYK